MGFMTKVRHQQPSLWHPGLTKDIEDLWEPWMRLVDRLLEDEQLLDTIYEAQGERYPQSRRRGREQTAAEVVLRLLLLKHIRNWSYDTLEREVRANLVYRAFTRIGDENFFLAYSHIGHDCQIGSNNLFVNAATLAGHVTIEDFTTIGALSPVHQFCRVGSYAYVGASTVITQDVPPFSRIVTERETKTFGANAIGLERRGFSAERVRALQRAFRTLLRSKLNTTQALEVLRVDFADSDDVRELVKFIEAAERGIVK